jgi:hypothetical protein
MTCKVCQMCCWDACAACAAAAGAGVAGGGAVCCCGRALAICLWSKAKYRSACLMLKSMSPATVHVGVAPCCWGGCAWDEDGRSSCSCWAAAALPVMRARILCSASMSCVEALSPSRLTSNTPEAVCSTSGTLAPAPVPAEGWVAEAEGLAGSGAGGGVVA